MEKLRSLIKRRKLIVIGEYDGLHSAHEGFFKALLVVGVNIFNKKVVSFKVKTPKAEKRTPFEDCFAEVKHEIKVGHNLFRRINSFVLFCKI